MNFNDYQKEAMKNKVYGYGDKTIYPTLGLVSEAGEVAGKVKKVLRDGGGDWENYKFIDKATSTAIPCKVEVAYELGDVLWYLAAVAEDIGYSLEDIAEMNIMKLSGRRERNTIKGSGDHR